MIFKIIGMMLKIIRENFNNYVDEAQRFVNDAYEYANCEIRNLD